MISAQTGRIGMKKIKERKAEEPTAKPNDSPTPSPLPSPKRGAFPTPKEDIEKSKPYIPDSEPTGSRQPTESEKPENADEGGKKVDKT
jgi:hypothetical protein